MSPLFRRPEAAQVPELARMLVEERDALDPGRLVRTLARATVHVPMPGAPAERQPRRSTGQEQAAGPPLYVVEDEEGAHALLYSSPRRLVEAWGPGVSAAAVPLVTLLARWPEAVDVVLDAGLPDALQLPVDLLRAVALEAGGVPTASTGAPRSGWTVRRPDPEPVQALGASRAAAQQLPEVRALWRAEALPDEPAPRATLTLVVEVDDVAPERLREVMGELTRQVGEADPRPVALLPVRAGQPGDRLAQRIRALDEPFWTRSAPA